MRYLLNLIKALQFWCLFHFSIFTSGQNVQPELPHIKVVLIGTFHFGATGDKGKIAFDDLFSPTRQFQLQTLTNQLAHLKPDKIFVENEPSRQAHWDSTFRSYEKGQLDTNSIRNEIFQVGIRLASKAGLSRVICVDYQQDLPYNKLQAFEKRVEKDSTAQKKMATYELLNLAYPYPKKTKKLANTSLIDYYLYINSAPYSAIDQADFFVYPPSYGYDNDYTGVAMITSWYERNAKIFTNILRQGNLKDKLYIVLFGSTHMLPLRHYFQNSPYFEVVELPSVLKP